MSANISGTTKIDRLHHQRQFSRRRSRRRSLDLGRYGHADQRTVSGNTATGAGGYGGGVDNYRSTATLTNCTVNGNSAEEGRRRLQLWRDDADQLHHQRQLHHGQRRWPALTTVIGNITLANCTVSVNSAAVNGGGLFISGSTTARRRWPTAPSAGTPPVATEVVWTTSGGTATLTNCKVSGNSATGGGGLFNANAYYVGTATLTNCTVSGNSALSGGGISNQGTLTCLLQHGE